MNKITLVPVTVCPKYLKKWNAEHTNDFVHLYVNGKKVSDTLYRIGGFGAKFDNQYFMLLKQVEDKYNDLITKDKKRKKHLADRWCIIDNNGKEIKVFRKFASPYIFGVVYSLNNHYFNIETGEQYDGGLGVYSTLSTEKYLFLDNNYDKDVSKRGVIKIDKRTGEYEVFN